MVSKTDDDNINMSFFDGHMMREHYIHVSRLWIQYFNVNLKVWGHHQSDLYIPLVHQCDLYMPLVHQCDLYIPLVHQCDLYMSLVHQCDLYMPLVQLICWVSSLLCPTESSATTTVAGCCFYFQSKQSFWSNQYKGAYT